MVGEDCCLEFGGVGSIGREKLGVFPGEGEKEPIEAICFLMGKE